MRESRTYGSVRGARHETRVPTATGVDGPLAASKPKCWTAPAVSRLSIIIRHAHRTAETMTAVSAIYRPTSGWLPQGSMPPSGWVPAGLVSSPNVMMDQKLFRFLKPLQWIKGRRSYFEATNEF